MEVVGRAAELESLVAMLARARVVTLWGGPGMGKSTLLRALVARCAAHAELEGESAPVLVDLELAHDEADVVSALALAVGVEADRHGVRRALRSMAPALLAFDHAERCLDGLATFLVEDLGLPIVIASRERLRTASEEPFPIEGLSRTPLDAQPCSAAAALFLARAERARAGARRDPNAIASAEAIARHLDGCPLALELAGGRARALPLSELAARLAHDRGLLRSLDRDAKARHRTLETSIRLSWDLLDAAERAAFLACGTFRATFTTADLSAVLQSDATLVVEALNAKSMLRIVEDGGPRLALLHALEDFATRELEAAGGAELLARHASHVLERCRAAVTLDGGRVVLRDRAELERIEGDLAVVLVRMRAGRVPRDAEGEVRLALALGRLRTLDGRHEDALRVLAPVGASANPELDALLRFARIDAARRVRGADVELDLAVLEGASDPSLARALGALARSILTKPDEPERRIERSREAARVFAALGLRASEASARARLADALRMRERWAEAALEGDRALALIDGDSTVDPTAVAHVRAIHAASAFDRGPIDDAARAVALAREAALTAGDRMLEAQLTLATGVVATERGDFDEAAGALVAGTERLRELGVAPWILANAVQYAGRLQLEQGANQAAAASFTEALSLGEANEPDPAAFTRACRAVALARLGDHGRAQTELDAARARLVSYRAAALPWFEALLALARGAGAPQPVPASAVGEDHRFVARLFARARGERAVEPTTLTALRVWTGGRGFARTPGAFVDLATRRPLRALLFALVEQRLAAPGVALPPERLIAIAWPGEKIAVDAARNRLRVSIAKLRSLGLDDLLLTQGSGYVLDPRVPLELRAQDRGNNPD